MSETGTELPKPEKKQPKASQQPEKLEAPKQFTPFNYSKSNFKVFAGKIWISRWSAAGCGKCCQLSPEKAVCERRCQGSTNCYNAVTLQWGSTKRN